MLQKDIVNEKKRSRSMDPGAYRNKPQRKRESVTGTPKGMGGGGGARKQATTRGNRTNGEKL